MGSKPNYDSEYVQKIDDAYKNAKSARGYTKEEFEKLYPPATARTRATYGEQVLNRAEVLAEEALKLAGFLDSKLEPILSPNEEVDNSKIGEDFGGAIPAYFSKLLYSLAHISEALNKIEKTIHRLEL